MEERTIQNVQNSPSNSLIPKAFRNKNLKSWIIYEMQKADCRFFSTENSWKGFDTSFYKERITT